MVIVNVLDRFFDELAPRPVQSQLGIINKELENLMIIDEKRIIIQLASCVKIKSHRNIDYSSCNVNKPHQVTIKKN
ncbi:hypothetical protein QE152_g13303 [Popillia japonica]|uniref:Uncharacterized protein n=1 Tax=Popillia japonica TaxID=7064 RepID=A0AAW1LEL8_POPJA